MDGWKEEEQEKEISIVLRRAGSLHGSHTH